MTRAQMVAPERLPKAARAGAAALSGLQDLARLFLELKDPAGAAAALADVDTGAAVLRFSLRMRHLEWGLSCEIERSDSKCLEITGPRDLCYRHFVPLMRDLIDLAREPAGARPLQQVARGRLWLFFEVEIRGGLALLTGTTARAGRPGEQRQFMHAGFGRLPAPTLH